MPDLSDYRARIDEIDGQITRLLERRMQVVEGIARYKLEKGMPVLQPEREAQVIEKQVARLENPENAGAIRGLYAEIMRSSRQTQIKLIGQDKDEPLPEIRDWVEHPRAAYPGVPGSFSEQAALDFFGDSAQISHFDQFEQVCQAVKAGEVDYGVLPIENSSTGAVTDSGTSSFGTTSTLFGVMFFGTRVANSSFATNNRESLFHDCSSLISVRGVNVSTRVFNSNSLNAHSYRFLESIIAPFLAFFPSASW